MNVEGDLITIKFIIYVLSKNILKYICFSVHLNPALYREDGFSYKPSILKKVQW